MRDHAGPPTRDPAFHHANRLAGALRGFLVGKAFLSDEKQGLALGRRQSGERVVEAALVKPFVLHRRREEQRIVAVAIADCWQAAKLNVRAPFAPSKCSRSSAISGSSSMISTWHISVSLD